MAQHEQFDVLHGLATTASKDLAKFSFAACWILEVGQDVLLDHGAGSSLDSIARHTCRAD